MSILDVQSFRETDCDTHHFLVFAKVWERMVINKQETEVSCGEIQTQKAK